MFIVYKATSKITGKCYIGYTNNLARRKRLHKFNAKTRSSKFYQAIRAQGFENFDWIEIYSTNDKEEAFTQEAVLIEQYDTINNGYNTVRGGWRQHDFVDKLPTELKCRLANGRQNKSFDVLFGERASSIKDKLRSSLKQHYKNNPGIRSGLNNTNADHNIYTFVNRDGREFKGTRFEFLQKYQTTKADRGNVCQLIKGNLKQHKGWTIT